LSVVSKSLQLTTDD